MSIARLSLVSLFALACSTPAPAATGDAAPPDAQGSDATRSESDASDASLGDEARALTSADAAVDPYAAVEQSMRAAGYQTSEGAWGAVDLSGCCAEGANCYANNPASPYFALSLPPASGQSASNPAFFSDAQGRSSAFYLGADEAIVLFTDLAPAAAYAAFTPYVYDRASGSTRAVVFASLNGGLNNTRWPGREGTRVAVILATSASAEAQAQSAVRAAGYSDEAILRLPWVFGGSTTAPPRLGLDASADTFALLGRLAVPADPAAASAYQSARFRALRATGTGSASAPAALDDRAQSVHPEPASLLAAVDRLERAVRASQRGSTWVPLAVVDGSPSPSQCLEQLSNCLGDNRDTDYPTSRPFVAPSGGGSVVVMGVNHQATGHATYSGVGIYSVAHAAGVVSVTSDRFAGSARAYLPSDPDVDQLFVWTFARSCGGAPSCTEVSTEACPAGLPMDAATLLMMRDYVDPTSATAPRYQDLIPYRAFSVRP